MKYKLALIFIVVLFSVSFVYGLDETHRCDAGGDECNFVWDVVNNSNKAQKLLTPCNVTVYDGSYTEVWSVLSDVTNTWHNVSMPVGTVFSDDWYHAERNCDGTISSFNFEVNTTLSNDVINLNMSVNATNIGESVWSYNLTNNLTAGQNLVNESSGDLFLLPITFIIIAFVLIYISLYLEPEFEPLRIIFFVLSLLLIIFSIFLGMGITQSLDYTTLYDALSIMYMVMLTILFLVIAYTIISFVMGYMKKIMDRKKIAH